MSEAPLKATLKAGREFSDPWLTVDGNDPGDLKSKLDYIQSSGLLDSLVGAANMLKAVNAVGDANGGQNQQAQQQNGWGGSATGTSQQNQQQAQSQPQNGAQFHPEGWTCGQCNSALEYKIVTRKSDNKQFKFWACPNQRSRDDGHRSEFA